MSNWQSEMTPEEWESIGHKPMNIMDKLLKRLWQEKEKQICKDFQVYKRLTSDKELNIWKKIN